MSSLRLLLVEDNERELATFRNTTERYEDEKTRKVELVECKTVAEAISKVDNTFDGAIIDLRLGAEGGEGNQITDEINKRKFPIPIAILTGTPEAADQSTPYVGVFTKGESNAAFDNLLDLFWDIHRTGLTRILGGRGTIQSMLGGVFWNSLMPQIESWTTYAATNPDGTEKALLRYTLNHLIQLIDEDIEHCFPEEFYLYPSPTDDICTGSVVVERDSGSRFVVMNPSCDLVVRSNGRRKTDMILVVEVVQPSELLDWFNHQGNYILSNKKRGELGRALRNSFADCYHCLPRTGFFELGFLDFRRLSASSECEFKQKFEMPPFAQISPPFIKDVVARFSSYYARQGQPDIDFRQLLNPAD